MNKHLKNSGFTLVELTVTMGIFVSVIFLVLSIFMNSIKVQRNVASQTTILDNLSLVIEQMAREIRTGTSFPEPKGPVSSLQFTNSQIEDVVYAKSGKGDYIEKTTKNKTVRLTADDIKIKTLIFYITKEGSYPPRVTIQIQVESALFKGPLTFQTTISERLFYYKKS
jgi:type II secretory pathway pseudopilin PulG